MYKKREKSPESRTLPQGVVRVNEPMLKFRPVSYNLLIQDLPLVDVCSKCKRALKR